MNQSLILKPRVATEALFFLAVSLTLIAAGFISQQPSCFIGAIMPLVLAAVLWMNQPAVTTLHFGPDSLLDEHHQEIVRYEEILGLTIAGRTPVAATGKVTSGSLVITAKNRNHEFPQLSRDAARQAYNGLIERIPESGSRRVVSTLESKLTAELKLFEDDLVFSYRGRREYPASHRNVNSFCIGLILGGIAWSVIGVVFQSEWVVCGVCALALATIIQVIARVSWQGQARVLHPDLASLIISPRGIAMIQGPLNGELKWSEVKSLSCERAPAGSLVVAHPAKVITIGVAGAQILIHDIYDRPLATIFRCINRFWETP